MKNNLFDLLRIVAALFVLISHQFALNGMAEPSFLGLGSFGFVGVAIFFTLSGYLLWFSLGRSSSSLIFLYNRALRIFPALVVSTLLTVFFIGPVVTTYDLSDYFSSSDFFLYFLNIVLVTRYTLPGVFESNAYANVVNGSLWTLPYEMLCYISLVMFGIRFYGQVNFLIKVIFLGLFFLLCASFFHVESIKNLGQLVYFFYLGVFFRIFIAGSDGSGNRLNFLLLLLLVLLGVLFNRGESVLLIGILGICFVYLFSLPNVASRFFDKSGDISYGLYIYAFPLQQIVAYNFSALSVVFQILMVLFFLVPLSFLSWFFVEKSFLKFKLK